MKNILDKLKSLFRLGNPDIFGPAVSGKLAGENTTSYIPFTQGRDNPVIATEEFVIPRMGMDLEAPVNFNRISAENKLWLTKVNHLRPDTQAPRTLDADSQYLLIGGSEYGDGAYRGIGIGYSSSSNRVAPVFIGAQEVNASVSGHGDFVVATRPTGDSVPPTVRFRITASGQITSTPTYTPIAAQDLVTKKYVDDAIAAALKKE